jgi:glycosyltransferase involved in cell wall biosynthesis
MRRAAAAGLVILLPNYNDWEALELLIRSIDGVFARAAESVRVVVIDDGSTTPPSASLRHLRLVNISAVDLVVLTRNLGHQRALAVGMCHVARKVPGRAFIIMDGDGEDAPADLPRLVEALHRNEGTRIVFAERLRRSEGMVFGAFYHFYRFLHWLLTGVKVRMGNFSILPDELLQRVVIVSEIWNHYTAAVLKSRLPYESIATKRAHRLAGVSRMNFVALTMHGLSAMSVFSDRIGVRLMMAASFAGMVVAALVASVVAIRFGTSLAIPGWATYTTGIAVVLICQIFTLLLVFVFMVLHSRSSTAPLLIREYRYYIHHVEALCTVGQSQASAGPAAIA